ncbi:MAG: GNAT family N-acetyltransferase [Anaerolineaceae bacterium]|nr:GNAT family N-acetyltransferase [Anaerolineaceae bacterium]
MLKTNRLNLRHFTDDDLGDFSDLVRDKMASKWAPYDHQWPTEKESLRGILAYFAGEDSWFAVELAREHRVIGFVAANRTEDELERDIGYCIHSDYQRQGFAFEACQVVIEHCQNDLGVTRFCAGTADCNLPSVRLLEKLGFEKIESVTASFASDAEGNPIEFGGGKYIRLLAAE